MNMNLHGLLLKTVLVCVVIYSRAKIACKLMFFAVFEMQFEDSSYTVSERAGSICVESLNHSEIAPYRKIPLSLVELSDEHLGIYPRLS